MTFQAEGLLKKVAAFEGFAEAARSELQGEKEAGEEPFLMRYAHPVIQEELDAFGNWVDKKCQNPNCEDGLAPRKTGPDDDDVDMEPCSVCGGPNAN